MLKPCPPVLGSRAIGRPGAAVRCEVGAGGGEAVFGCEADDIPEEHFDWSHHWTKHV